MSTAQSSPAPAPRRRLPAWTSNFGWQIAAALVLGDLYFPADNPTAGVLAAFATFAVGFLARPIGGIVA
ncbi:MFS transporter, partial [Streptomyces sp. NPDC052101]